MKGIGGLLAGGIIPTAGAAASTSKDSEQRDEDGETTGFGSELSVENGRVIVTGGDVSQPTVKQFDQTDSEPELDAESIAGFLNHGVEQGNFKVFEEGGEVMVKPTVSLESSTSSTPSLQPQQVIRPPGGGGCGIDSLDWFVHPFAQGVFIKMDHDTTERVALQLLGGAALSEAAAIVIGASGVGAVPAAIAGLLGVALGYFAGALTIIDDGCGVVIEYVNFTVPYRPSKSNIAPQ